MWWAGALSWIPKTVAFRVATSTPPLSVRTGFPQFGRSNGSDDWSRQLATIELDGTTGEVVSRRVSQDFVAAGATTQVAVSRIRTLEANWFDSAGPGCLALPVAVEGHSALHVKLQLQLPAQWMDVPLVVVATSGFEGEANPLHHGFAVGPPSAEARAVAWSCQQLPLHVVTPQGPRTRAGDGRQRGSDSSRLAMGLSAPSATVEFSLPAAPASGETLVAACESASEALEFGHESAAIDGTSFELGKELQVQVRLSASSSPVIGDARVKCSFVSTSASIADAKRAVLAARQSSPSQGVSSARRRLVEVLLQQLPAPPAAARFANLEAVEVDARLVAAKVPLVRDVLVKQAGVGADNSTLWRSSAVAGIRVRLNSSEVALPAATIQRRLGQAWADATRMPEDAAISAAKGAELTSSGGSEVILVMHPGSLKLRSTTQVLVGAAQATQLAVAADGSTMRLVLPPQSEACNVSRGQGTANGSWIELRRSAVSVECGWQGMTILPDGDSQGHRRWAASSPVSARLQPLCQAPPTRPDLVAEGDAVALCLVGVERTRVASHGFAIAAHDAATTSLAAGAEAAGYVLPDGDGGTLQLASGAPVAQTLAVYFADQCDGYEAPGQACIDGTAVLACAHGSGDACRPCSALCPAGQPACAVCPGGFRVWPLAGFWVRREGDAAVHRCQPPAERRCAGWDLETGTSRCGEGFTGEVCAACDHGFFPDPVEGCARCPEGTPLELLLIPVGLYGGLAVGLVASSMSLFGLLQCSAPSADRRKALVKAKAALQMELGQPAHEALPFAAAEVDALIRTTGSVPRLACDRSMAGRAAGKAAQLGIWAVLTLQTLVQVSRSLAAGVPPVVGRAFALLSVFELSPSVAVHPKCLSLPELTVETGILAGVLLAALLVGSLAACVSCGQTRANLGVHPAPSSAEKLLPRAFTLANVTYVLGVNTIVAVLFCVPDRSAAGASAMVMASNPYIQCGTAEHTRAWVLAVPAAVCVAAGLPIGVWLFTQRRIAWLLESDQAAGLPRGPRMAGQPLLSQAEQPSTARRSVSLRPQSAYLGRRNALHRTPGRFRSVDQSLEGCSQRRRASRQAVTASTQALPSESHSTDASASGPATESLLQHQMLSPMTPRVPKHAGHGSLKHHSSDLTTPKARGAGAGASLTRNPMLATLPAAVARDLLSNGRKWPKAAKNFASASPGGEAEHRRPARQPGRSLWSASRATREARRSSRTPAALAAGDAARSASKVVRGDVALSPCVGRDFKPSRAWHVPAGMLAIACIGISTQLLSASPVRSVQSVVLGSSIVTAVCCFMAAIVVFDQPYAPGHAWKRWVRALTLLLTALTAWLNLSQLVASGVLAVSDVGPATVDFALAERAVAPMAFLAFALSVMLLVAMASAVIGGLGRDTAAAISCRRCARRIAQARAPLGNGGYRPVVKRFGHAVSTAPARELPGVAERISKHSLALPPQPSRRLSERELLPIHLSRASPTGSFGSLASAVTSTRRLGEPRDRLAAGLVLTRQNAH